ncbi:MAG: AraC family ligand binding domain-containing protein, partial [Planctomycetes bacterium]|nr:AraC family ligand binding domain-containing protein [Planctomycetota bacterium]
MKIDQEQIINDKNSSFRCMRHVRREISFYLHMHAEYELVLIESGHGQRFIGDAFDNFTAGDLVLVPPHMPHTWKAAPFEGAVSIATAIADEEEGTPQMVNGYEVVCFQFHEHWISDQFSQMPECESILSFLKSADRALHFDAQEASMVRQRLMKVDMNRPFDRWMCLMQCLHELSLMESNQVISSSTYQA